MWFSMAAAALTATFLTIIVAAAIA